MFLQQAVFRLGINYCYLNYVHMICPGDPILTLEIFILNVSGRGSGRSEDRRK